MLSYSDGSTRSHTLEYESFFRTGEVVRSDVSASGNLVAGGLFDVAGKPIMDMSYVNPTNGVAGRQIFSDSPDGMALIPGSTTTPSTIRGVTGNPVFAVTNFEYVTKTFGGTSMYGLLPMAIGIATLDQDKISGALRFVKYENVNMSEVNGLWIPCAGSVSPWGTFLSSEEYEPNAAATSNVQLSTFSQNFFGDATKAKPYHYGWTPEVTVNTATGTGTVVKHYSMGRFSKELTVIAPDQRTAYFGDDATNACTFLYIADKAADLSAGSLYAAKFSGKYNLTTGSAPMTVSWIKLGAANDSQVFAWADTLKASDIFDIKTVDPVDTLYTKIYFRGNVEWVKIVPGMERPAAFLESARYASYMGATCQFSKFEGVTINAKDKKFYAALQNVESSMVKGHKSNDAAGPVVLDKGLAAGSVNVGNLAANKLDSNSVPILSDWVLTDFGVLLKGTDNPTTINGHAADENNIAAPDNIKYSEVLRTLFIGEDCSQHVTCMIWAYNVDSKTLIRVGTVPIGAEATGLEAYDNLNNFTYLTASFQHPGDTRVAGVSSQLRAWGADSASASATAALLRRVTMDYHSAYIGHYRTFTDTSNVQMQSQIYFDVSASPAPVAAPSSSTNPNSGYWSPGETAGLAVGVGLACLWLGIALFGMTPSTPLDMSAAAAKAAEPAGAAPSTAAAPATAAAPEQVAASA